LTESALLPVDEAELFDRLYKKLESEDNWYLLLDANVSLKLIPKIKDLYKENIDDLDIVLTNNDSTIVIAKKSRMSIQELEALALPIMKDITKSVFGEIKKDKSANCLVLSSCLHGWRCADAVRFRFGNYVDRRRHPGREYKILLCQYRHTLLARQEGEGDLLCHKDVAGVVSGPTINGEIQSIRLCLEHMHRCDEWAAKQKHATLR
jgi:hypothetical protein